MYTFSFFKTSAPILPPPIAMEFMQPNFLRSAIQITKQQGAQQYYPEQCRDRQFPLSYHSHTLAKDPRLFTPQPSCFQNSNTVGVPSIQDVPHSAVKQSHSYPAEPYYVNSKQFHRILVRREFREKFPIIRGAYLHRSRSNHAQRRPRGPGGRFLSVTKEKAARTCGRKSKMVI